MKRAFAGSVGIVTACLMVGLLGVVAVTGRWPVDAPRTHIEASGILALSVERVARIEFSADEQSVVFSRTPGEGWLINGAATGPAVASHIDTAIRLLTISAARRVLAAGEYSPDQLAVYGLDPPRFGLAITETGGNTTRFGFGEATPAGNAQYVRIIGRPELYLLRRACYRPWHVYAAFAVMSVGWATMSGAAINIIVAPWFDRRRGLAVSWALNGASAGGIIIAPLLTFLTARFGFVFAMGSVSASMLAILIPVATAVLAPPEAHRRI